MSPTTEGGLVLVATLIMLVSGIPVAFGLGAVSIVFLLLFQGIDRNGIQRRARQTVSDRQPEE